MNIQSMPRFLWNEMIAPRIISCCCAQPFITEQRRQSRLMEQSKSVAQVSGWEFDALTRQLYWTQRQRGT